MEAKQRPPLGGSGRNSKLTTDLEDDWAQEKNASGKNKFKDGKGVGVGMGRSDSKAALLPAESKLSSESFDVAEEKARILEIQQEIEAEAEFERLKSAPVVSTPCVAKSPLAKEFVRGFQM